MSISTWVFSCSLTHVVSTSVNSNQRNEQKAVSSLLKKDKNTEKAEETIVTKVVSPATKEISNAELRFVVNEIDGRPKKYQKEIPEKVKKGRQKSCIETWNIVSHQKIFRKVYKIYVYQNFSE